MIVVFPDHTHLLFLLCCVVLSVVLVHLIEEDRADCFNLFHSSHCVAVSVLCFV